MKRFLLFEWEQLNAEGGWRDFVMDFESLALAKVACLNRVFDADNPNVFVVRQVVDRETGIAVAQQFDGKWIGDAEAEVAPPKPEVEPIFEADGQGRLF